MRRNSLLVIGLAGTAVSWIAAPVAAQNALGDGRRLDRSLNTQSQYNTGGSRRAFYDDVRLRNAVVTGNAAGGRSFRGDVGYTGGSDFRGNLGSEDVFTFRRDASFSAALNSNTALRGVGGLQYQMGGTAGSGNSPTANMGLGRDDGGLLVRRAGSGTASSEYLGTNASGERRKPRPGVGSYDSEDLRADYTDNRAVMPTAGAGALRSTSAYSTSQSFNPALVGQREEQDGSITSLTASSLRGVRASNSGARTLGSADPAAAAGAGAGARPATGQQNLQANLQNPAAPRSPNALAPREAKTAYDALMEEYSEQTGTTAGTDPVGNVADWRKQLEEMRGTLDGTYDPATALLPENQGPQSLPVDEAAPAPVRLYNQATIDLISRRAKETSRLLVTDEVRLGAFGERMRRGEVALAEGRYFDAEEAFSTCLSLRPGDVAASIGRVHAQIGAGMFLSAALNLRMTLGEHPEIIGTWYGEKLLPQSARSDAVIAELRSNVASGDRLGFESAALLAYLSYQRGDKAGTVEGLDAVERLAAQYGRQIDSRFVELVRRVWLPLLDKRASSSGAASGAAPSTPTEAPAPAATPNEQSQGGPGGG